MKTFNQIRYVLFALMVLGCFANFAQNEYGLDIFYVSHLLIAIIFFIESFIYFRLNYRTSKTKAFYLFSEHFWLGCNFLGNFFRHMHWPGGGPLLIFGVGILVIQYFIYGIRTLIKEYKKGALLALIVFLFIATTIAALNGLTWKIMHWPGSMMMVYVSFYTTIFLLLVGIIKRRYSYDGQIISFKGRIMKIPGKMRMTFSYFTIWVVYILLIFLGIGPNFYTLSTPPAVEKMRQDRNPNEEIYWENYSNFIENRRAAEEK